MSTLSEQEIVTVAYERLKERDACIFCWYYYGKPDKDGKPSARWTYNDLCDWFLMQRGGVSASLKRSRTIVLEAVRVAQQKQVSATIHEEGDSPRLDFRIWCQIGNESLTKQDSVEEFVVQPSQWKELVQSNFPHLS